MSASENVNLTSSEMASLWNAYISNTHIKCVLEYFVAKAEDDEVLDVLKDTLKKMKISEQNNKQILQAEHMPLPIGFNEQDVDVTAPRLFSDTFSLKYIKNMARVMLVSSSLMYTMSTRRDIRDHFKQSINQATKTFDTVSDVLLSKGVYVRPPIIDPPKKVDFIEDKDYLNGKNFLKDQRYLNTIEISHVFGNLEANVLGNALIKGFEQTADLKHIRDFMGKAGQLSEKVIHSLTQFLTGSKLPSPMGSEAQVFSSFQPPFSDKLMMYELSMLIAAGVSDYATSLASSLRNDLRVHYMDLLTDTAKLAKEAESIMIKNSWLEQPPQQDKMTT